MAKPANEPEARRAPSAVNGRESLSEGSGWEGGSSAKVKAAVLADFSPLEGPLLAGLSIPVSSTGHLVSTKKPAPELRTTGLPKSSRTFLTSPQPPFFFSISCFQRAVNSTEPGGFVLLGGLQRGGSWAQAHLLGTLQRADKEIEDGTP